MFSKYKYNSFCMSPLIRQLEKVGLVTKAQLYGIHLQLMQINNWYTTMINDLPFNLQFSLVTSKDSSWVEAFIDFDFDSILPLQTLVDYSLRSSHDGDLQSL